MSRKRSIKIGVSVIFIILLSVPLLIEYIPLWSQTTTKGKEQALERYGFYLNDVTEEAGIGFTHQAPDLDPKLEHIMPQIASVGASVSVTDYNNDGWQDIYVTNSKRGTKNALYRNDKDGTFTNVAEKMGVANLNSVEDGVSMGAVWGDYDNDGYEDLFVYKWGKPVLFHNEKGKGFSRVTEDTGLPVWVNANTAIWLDYNRDGYIDLFIGGYYDEQFDLWELETTRIMPESFEYANNGGRNYLLKNQGDGTFTDVTEKVGLESNRWTFAASAADLTGNHYPELVIANDFGKDRLYVNKGGKRFVRAGQKSNVGFTPKSGMSVSFGDILNNGNLSIYVTNISEPGILLQGNNLWLPDRNQQKGLKYRNLAGNMGVEMGGWSYGAQFGDFNNDGHVDLYVANGFISARKGSDYWYDYSMVTGGNKEIISDAENWPAMEGRSQSGYQTNRIWINSGSGNFHEVSSSVGGKLKLDSRGVAVADLWNRGVLDILVASQRGPFKIFETQVTETNHWIGFKLAGTRSNSSAIGAEVTLYWNGQKQKQIVSGGTGFSSQNQRRVYFGLGSDPEVEKVKIVWPSGAEQILKKPEIGRLHKIRESSDVQ